MDNYILPLLQFCDSSLPTGAFSHSFGLETYIQEGFIHSKESFLEWMKTYIGNSLVYSDGLACRFAYEALENDQLGEIWKLDQMLLAQIFAQESRDGSRKMGERLLTLANELYPSLPIATYIEKVNKRECNSHPALVFAMMSYSLNIPKSTTIISYLFSTITTLIQNAVRGIPLGQTEGQQLLKESHSLIIKACQMIESLTYEDFAITPPGIEISQMQHERVNIRIFMS